MKNLSKLIAIVAIAAIAMPGLAFAKNGRDHQEDRVSNSNTNSSNTNEFGVRILGEDNPNRVNDDNDHNRSNGRDGNNHDNDRNDDNGKHRSDDDNFKILHSGFLSNLFYNGTVTAISSTGFTITTKDGTVLTIDADSAKIIQIPRTVIALADISIGDVVHITGTKTDSTVDASVIYALPENLKPAMAKGTVTTVTDDTITVQTKDNTEITVNTTDDTKIVDSDHEVIAQEDIETGSKVKLFGLWDSILNVFNAIKISLKS